MYSVVAADGRSYGPVDVPTLKNWCLQGRVTPDTNLIDGVSGRTMRAADLQDLYGIFPDAQPPAYSGPSYVPPQNAYAYQQPPARAGYVSYAAIPSDFYAPKSKVIAILLAFFLGHFGIHRFYLGQTNTAWIMFGLWIFAFILIFTVVGLILSIPIFLTLWVWSMVDIILVLTDNLKDGQGYKLTN